MPSDKYKQAYKEALAQARSDVVLLDTFEITSELATTEVKRIDVCFVIDTSGSMGGPISWLSEAMQSTMTALEAEFEVVRFGLVSFGQSSDSGNPIFQSNLTTNAATIQNILDGLTASGFREPVFDAISMACDTMSWSSAFNVRKHIVVVMDESGEDSGQTFNEAQTLEKLNARSAALSQTRDPNTGGFSSLSRLQSATSGSYVRLQEANIEADIIAALKKVNVIETDLEPLYLIPARQPYELTLETGLTKIFEPTGVRFTLPGQNDQGLQDLNIAIDNVDERIGRWIETASLYDAQALAKYRPYLSTDLTAPQMDPPLTLTLSDLKRNAFEVSGRATVADIVNLKFLRELYTRRRFPSLGNT